MKKNCQSTAERVKRYCAEISEDPLLVQGAGGNASWKDGEVLWVKASGRWLADAENDEIFVPVDLVHLRAEIADGDFTATPRVICDSNLIPSIETMLHALMPHKIVMHLHAVEILVHLVRRNSFACIKELVGNNVKWIFVDYIKPGAELAQAVSAQLTLHFDADVVFLESHGLLIGAADIKSMDMILKKLISLLKTKQRDFKNENLKEGLITDLFNNFYKLSGDVQVNQLATNSELLSRVKNDWALFPDHIVFLGEKAIIVSDTCEQDVLLNSTASPSFIFVTGKGVYENPQISNVHRAQLRAYYDVLTRQPNSELLASLSSSQVAELLNWDSEKYRQTISPMSRPGI